MTIEIPDWVYSTYEDGVDAIISGFGIPCTIVYPPIKNECPNCYFISLPGVGSTNTYKPSGPYPFSGVCPYCEGSGIKEERNTAAITVRVYYDKKSWNKILPTIGIKNGDALIIGYMKDIPKFQNMAHIELSSDVDGFAVRTYVLSTDLTPWGIKKRRYFYCTVERR